MESKGRKIDFREADQRCSELIRQHDLVGKIGDEKFHAQLKQLTAQDDEGSWWAEGREANERHYRDESGWVRGMPPRRPPPAEEASANRSDLHRPSRLPLGVGYEMHARSYRNTSKINNRHRKRSQIVRRPAIETWNDTDTVAPAPEGEEREALHEHEKVR